MSTETRVLLLRHGHVDGIVPKRFRGRMELPLTDLGRRQAADAADFIQRRASPLAVYCSPLQRCIDTARALATATPGGKPEPLPALTDIDYGLWQGRLAEEVARTEADAFRLWHDSPERMTFPQGESLVQVADRTSAALRELLVRNEGQCIALVTHDSVIRVILLTALKVGLSAYHRVTVNPCGLSELRAESADALSVVRVNEATSERPD